MMDGKPIFIGRVAWHEKCPVHPTYDGEQMPRGREPAPNCSCWTIWERKQSVARGYLTDRPDLDEYGSL